MAITYKVLGQLNPAATTLTTLYTVPAGASTVISTLNICNQAATATTFRIAVRPAAATIAALHYLTYDTVLPANDRISLTLGITLAATDVISVYASTGTISFALFGSEIT
jgi:hypothetical protein